MKARPTARNAGPLMHTVALSVVVGTAMMSIGPTAFAQASSPVTRLAACLSTGRSIRAIARLMKTSSSLRIRQCGRWQRARPPWHAVRTEAVAGKRGQRAAARTTRDRQFRYRRCRRTHHPTRQFRNSVFSSDRAGQSVWRSIGGFVPSTER